MTEGTITSVASDAPTQRELFGHPFGLAYVVVAEGFQFFAYSGAQALLTLYLTKQLFVTGNAENVLGLAAYRAAMEAVFGSMTTIGLASQTFGLFTGLAYAQFPDRARYRIMLEDLQDEAVRDRLRAVWNDPKALDPAIKSAKITREVADLLATVSRRLEGRGYNAESVSGFLMRILFTMFAEDTGVLLPKDSFVTFLREHESNPQHLHHSLSALWRAMDKGEFAPALRVPVKQFNG